VATAGLQCGLRTAAAAAAAVAASSNNNNASLEGRLLPAHLVAAPSRRDGDGNEAPPFLLRLMEQRYGLGNDRETITVITPHDVDAIFDALQARGCEDGDPYWARVWPSAVALAECLLARPELVKGKRVADVGAGLGVGGLAAALAGAREVVLLDREPLALECARLSAEATGRGRFEVARPPAEEAIAVVAGSDEASSSSLRPLTSIHDVLGDGATVEEQHQQKNQRVRVSASPFDWHARPLPPHLRRKFDVVLACDVLYERDAVEPLAEVVPLLMADGARLLLADPPARTAENRKRFLELLERGGGKGRRRFAVDEAALEQCAPRQLDRELLGGQQEGRPVPVQLLHLRAVEGNDTVGLKAGAF
jgi:predicted nicotinamide N-methyase